MIDPDSLRILKPNDEPERRWSPDLAYLLDVGYRPFFLLAVLAAAALMLLWGVMLAGVDSGARAVAAPAWHGHEMLWGYSGAILLGFLFTAGRNWTRHPTVNGRLLALAALLWLGARLFMALSGGAWAAFAIEIGVWFIALWAIGRAIVKTRSTLNYPVLGLTAAFAASDILWHLPVDPLLTRLWLALGLASLTAILVIIGGRIIPAFTASGVGSRPESRPWIEHSIWPLTLVCVLAFGLHPTGLVPPVLLAALACASAMLHALRLWLWWDRGVLTVPLVWILHGAYAMLVLHFALAAATAGYGSLAAAALHSLTAGALGTMMIGMLARVALGHGGRPLHVGLRTRLIFGLVFGGALLRISAALSLPYAVQIYRPMLLGAAGCWVVALLMYAWLYGPVLIRAGRGPIEKV